MGLGPICFSLASVMFAFPQVHVSSSNPEGLTQPAVEAPPPPNVRQFQTVHAASPEAAASTPSSQTAFVPEFTVSSSASYAEWEPLNVCSALPWTTNNSPML